MPNARALISGFGASQLRGVRIRKSLQCAAGSAQALWCASLRRLMVTLFTPASPAPIFSSPARPTHALLPLSELLKVEFNCDYYEGQEEELVKKVLSSNGAALISWKHNNMHLIASAILEDSASAPQRWPVDRVDLVWVFDRQGSRWTFTQVPQRLLAGDRSDVAA